MSNEQTDQVDHANPFAPSGQSSSARNLMTVALQIIGLWMICRSVMTLPQIAAYVMYAMGPSEPFGPNWIATAVMLTAQFGSPLVVGTALILLAGRIARRFYPPSVPTSDTISFGRVGAGDLYQIVSFMLGVYVLIQAVAPAVRFFENAMGAGTFSREPWANGGIHDMITASVYSLAGLFLIFGSRGIAQTMAAIPRDSDGVPVPQFSIRMLLILGVAFAVVLGILRAVVVGIRL